MLDGGKLRAHEGINWHAHALVRKYSDDQVDWARAGCCASRKAGTCMRSSPRRRTAMRRLTGTCW